MLGLLLPQPSVAAPVPPELESYGTLPKTEDADLSPDGTMYAVVETVGDSRVVSIKHSDGSLVVRATLGDLKLYGLAWAANDYLVVYLHETVLPSIFSREEHEYLRGVIVSVKDGSARPLLRTSGDYMPVLFGRFGFVQMDGRPVGFFGLIPTNSGVTRGGTSNFTGQRYPDLFQIDIETGAVAKVIGGARESRNWVVDAKGQVIAESQSEPNSGDWKVFLPGSPRQPLVSGNAPFGFALMGLGRTPGTILVRQGGTNGDISELHLDTGQFEKLLPSGKAMTLIHSRSTRQLLGAVLVDDNQTILFDPTLERHVRALEKAFAGDRVELQSVSDDLNRILVHISGRNTAGTWELVDFKTGKAAPIAEDYPQIPDATIGNAQIIEYRASDGMTLQGVLTLPPDIPAHNLPLIMMPHSGADGRSRVEFDWRVQALASRGYAIFQPNFRGSGGYGMGFFSAGFGELGRKMQTDMSDGLAVLAAKGIVDSHRTCIVGSGSYGGYAALAGVTVQQGLYRCAVSFGGISDLRDLVYSLKSFDEGDTRHYADPSIRFWLSYLGVKSPDDPLIDRFSPQAQAAKADAPVLLMYGEHDTSVRPTQSTDMASALERAGKSVEIVRLEGEDQWLSRSATRLQMLTAMVAFVEKYNPPGPPATH